MQHVYHLLNDYHDNELSAVSRRRVEVHLENCSSCRTELGRLVRLSGLLSEYALPDVFTAAETFQAQVVLRVSRRAQESARYKGAAWHLVPLALLSVLVVLQALFGLSGMLGTAVRSAEWLGFDTDLFLAQLGIARPAVSTILGLSLTSVLAALGVVLMIGLYVGLFVLLIPYAGWVGALWRSARASQASLRR